MGQKTKPKNLLGDMGFRSKRSRNDATPPRMTAQKAQSISASLGITTHPVPASNQKLDKSIEQLESNLSIPLPDEPEAPASPIPDAASHFAQESRSWWNAEARRNLKLQWNAIEFQMTATYLELQYETRNWTSEASYLDLDIDCQCSNSDLTMQPVDLIDILGFHSKHQILFCACMPKPVRLLHYGYISSSPQSPQTAFSVRLLQFHHQLWNTTVISSTGFINALMSFLNLRSKTNLKPQTYRYRSLIHERDLRRQFSNSVNMYRTIMLCMKKIYNEALKLSNAQLLADRCGRCFGPAINEQKSPEEPHVIVALDGNFQHRHYTKSSKDNPTEDEYPEIFIKPSLMTKHEILQRSTEAQAKNIKNPCSDSHTAANDVRNSTSWKRSDDTGLFGCTCRHDVPLKLANIYKTGEKLYYPLSILEQLLLDLPDIKVAVLYDIGCQLDAHIKKRNFFEGIAHRLKFGTSVFHAYVHNWACQVLYNPRFNAFWGLTDGEGLERFWSFLASLVAVNRISTRLHRLLNINWRADYFMEITLKTTGDWLLRRLRNAQNVLRDTRSALSTLSQERSSLFPTIRYTYEFLRDQWILERNSQHKRCYIQEDQKIELGRLLCLEEMAQEIWDRDAEDVDEAISRLDEHTKIKKKIEKQRSKIGSEAILTNLTAQEQDQILKIWYAKQEVRNQFVAICEQKHPLDVSRRDGKNSSIGYNDKTHLLKSLRDQAAKLKTKLESYQKLVTMYFTTSPHRSQPPSIPYLDLLKIDFDHSFWNDGLFTNGREPWAVDSNTQHGMRQAAYYDRAHEEIRRLGWEVRRVMRWSIDLHKSLSTHLCRLQAHGPPDKDPLPLVDHPALISLSSAGKITASKVILNQRLVRIFNLQADWNKCLGEVLHNTPSQEGDNDLKLSWRNQIQKIHTMYSQDAISLNPGMVTDMWRGEGTQANNQVDDEVLPDHDLESEGVTNTDDLNGDSSDEDIDPEWEDIDEAMM